MIRTTDINEFNTLIKTNNEVLLVDSEGYILQQFIRTETLYKKEYFNNKKSFIKYIGQTIIEIYDYSSELGFSPTSTGISFLTKFEGRAICLIVENGKLLIENMNSLKTYPIETFNFHTTDIEKFKKVIDKARKNVLKLEISDELKGLLLNKYLKLEEV